VAAQFNQAIRDCEKGGKSDSDETTQGVSSYTSKWTPIRLEKSGLLLFVQIRTINKEWGAKKYKKGGKKPRRRQATMQIEWDSPQRKKKWEKRSQQVQKLKKLHHRKRFEASRGSRGSYQEQHDDHQKRSKGET